jgi:hypothetical protein
MGALRGVVQGLLLHRDWAPAYGVTGDAIRIGEQNLRSTAGSGLPVASTVLLATGRPRGPEHDQSARP